MLIVQGDRTDKAREYCMPHDCNFAIKDGSLYLGRLTGDPDLENEWVKEKTNSWAQIVEELSTLATLAPQTENSAAQRDP